jgi:DNA-binding MarR family transcriptional regulator
MTDEANAIDLMPRLFHRLVWLDEALQARLHQAGWPDVSRAQSMVMLNVTSGIRRPSDIARRLGVSRQAVHVTIGQMIDLGVLRLVEDPRDGRSRRVELTPFGDAMRHAAQDAMQDIAARLVERIGRETLHALLDALRADWGPAERE